MFSLTPKRNKAKTISEELVKEVAEPNFFIENCKASDLELHETLGTGTFGRVRMVRHKGSDKYFALKVLKKQEVVRLKQLEHVMNEKKVLAQ
ncbi:hypothetical protein T484DRAFT_1786722, partial [Baffinella frigidus]